MYRLQTKNISARDFDWEVRSKRDTEGILSTAKIVAYDQPPEDLKALVSCMIDSLGIEKDDFQPVKKHLMQDIDENGRPRNYIQAAGSGSSSSDWLVCFSSHSSIRKRHVSIFTLSSPANYGFGLKKLTIIALVLAPSEGLKFTKSALETSLTLATLIADPEFRKYLRSPDALVSIYLPVFINFTVARAVKKSRDLGRQEGKIVKLLNIWTGVKENIIRRSGYYLSDFTDGIYGEHTLSKVVSSALFMYFLCILPTVALGVLNAQNTNGLLDANRALMGEAIGGLLFSVMAGQPFVVIATTAPLSLCNQIIFDLSRTMEVDFYSLYGCIGMFNSMFLIIYGLLGLNSLITFSTRSVEELFLAFSVVCFAASGIEGFMSDFHKNYYDPGSRSISILYLLLMLSTVAIAMLLLSFKFSRFLTSFLRETISDYAVPVSVVVVSLIDSFVFTGIDIEKYPVNGEVEFKATTFSGLTTESVIVSAALGFAVSILFFMDQGISAQLVNTPANKLKKGNANDLDFILVALINIIMSVFGFPWMNGLLPHSPLHVVSLADWTERIGPDGRVERVVVHVRETRLAIIFCHVLILLTVTCVPEIFSYIPVPALGGLFLYCAIASMQGNSFFDRCGLIFTQQSSYPPNHVVRKVKQKKIHLFTLIQSLQLLLLCFIGMAAPWPIVRMMFPLLIALSIPFRHFVLPLWIEEKDLKTLDSYN